MFVFCILYNVDYMDSILRSSKERAKRLWTEEELRAGFLHFFKLYSHYPTAHEIDDFEFLPSSRSIQRSFGGLKETRRKLGLPVEDYTKGEYRADKAREGDARARVSEEEFFLFLTKHFEEIAVHEQKVIRPGNVRSDFFIFMNKEEGVVIDVFYANRLKYVSTIVSIKLKTYARLSQPVYFVLVGNDSIAQEEISKLLAGRTTPLPSNIRVVSEAYFKTEVIPLFKSQSAYAVG